MSEATPSTTNDIIETLRSVMAATSQVFSPAELERMTCDQSARVSSIIKATVDTAWQCAHREALDAVTRSEQAKRRVGDINVQVGGEQNRARALELVKADTEKVAAETERLRVEALKVKAETEKEIAQKERLVVEVERFNAEIVIHRLRIELLNKGWKG